MRSLVDRELPFSTLRRLAGFAMVAAVCAVPTAFLAPAAAEAAWLPPASLSPETGANSEHVKVGIDGEGNAFALWETNEGAGPVIESSSRPVTSGVWQSQTALSTAGEGASQPRLAVDAAGDAVAVWRVEPSAETAIEAAYRPAGAAKWHKVAAISGEGEQVGRPQVAINSHGEAVAVWQRYVKTGLMREYVIESAIRPASGGPWQAPVRISSEAVSGEEPAVAVDRKGDVASAWKNWNGENASNVAAALRPSAVGEWQAPEELFASGEGNALNVQVGLDSHGNATVLWLRNDTVFSAVRLAAAASWSTPVVVSATGEDVIGEQGFAVDRTGEATAVWASSGSSVKSASRLTAGGSWQAPIVVALAPAGRSVQEPNLAVDREGNAVAVWAAQTESSPVRAIVQTAAHLASAASWGATTTLTGDSENAFDPLVALSANGDAVAGWELHPPEAGGIVQSSFYEP